MLREMELKSLRVMKIELLELSEKKRRSGQRVRVKRIECELDMLRRR